ncbi:MAG: hypothetical protein JXA10_08565 [Anaerolineae bacterium]|nr:hypothetical protein [Anaerolineae bacterium]
MQTITLKTQADQDGLITLAIPTDLAGREIEIVLVMHPLDSEPVDEMGYPLGYFEETYGMFAGDPIERDQPLYPDVRDEIQ